MGGKRESLKKSLGISEYPWSSDDDDVNTNEIQSQNHSHPPEDLSMVNLLRRQPSSSTSQPMASTSAAPSGSNVPSPPVRRSHATRIERNLFWSLLCNPNRAQMDILSRPRANEVPRRDQPRPRPYDRMQRRGGPSRHVSPLREIRGFLAIKKRANNLHSLRPDGGHLYTIPRAASGSAQPSRSSLFDPSLHNTSSGANAVGQWVQNARPNLPQNYFPSSFSPDPQPSTSGETPVITEPPSQASPANVQMQHSTLLVDSDVETEEPVNLRRDSESITVRDSPPTATVMSLEEEVIEVEPVRDVPAEVNTVNQQTNENTQTDEATPEIDEKDKQSDASKRGVKRDARGDVKELNQSLLRLLECPVCLEWMEPPMSQCRRGHLVCVACRSRLSACPVCRTAFSSVRNRAMEGVAEMLRYPCRHACGREVRLRRRATHEASCAARHYACPLPGCAARAPAPQHALLLHMQTVHRNLIRMGTKHRFNIKVNAEQHENWLIITSLEEIFHVRIDVDIRTWGVAVYVSYLGPKNAARTFRYEVMVVGRHNERKLIYTRAVHSDLESQSLNLNRQDCFHLSLDQALNFLRIKNHHSEADNFLNISVGIFKNETEVERDDSGDSRCS